MEHVVKQHVVVKQAFIIRGSIIRWPWRLAA
jgi:hypothetical protein